METNAQHYLNDILAMYLSGGGRCNFIRKNILNDSGCCNFVTCNRCEDRIEEWLNAPYEEPKIEIDWSKVPVDTPVIVKDSNGEEVKRYFAKYNAGFVFTFDCGATSWSANDVESARTYPWKIYELAREEDIEKYRKE